MSGDISLSQSLGGLRIANPDDDSTPSPPPAPAHGEASPAPADPLPASSASSAHTVTAPDEPHEPSHLLQPVPTESSTSTLDFNPGAFSTSQTSLALPKSATPPVPDDHSQSSARLNHRHEEWKEKGAAVGVRQEMDSNGKPISRVVKKGVSDFSFGRTLGEGSYSTVLAATDRQTLREYAIKVLDKRHIIKEKKVKYVNIEKDTLNRLTEHPGVVRLYYTFQDERSLYFVLDLATGGELLGFLKKMGTFDEECARYYGAQILDAIDYMHSRDIIHRDLKPENVLLDDQMHVKITDFGTAKILNPKRPPNAEGPPADPLDGVETDRAESFVGTAEYVSPELLTDKNACKASDLWAFGCIIYQLLAGRPPFKAGNEYQTFQKIVNLEYSFPDHFPEAARDLVERLLVLDPAKRLPVEHIKTHQFFDGIQWGREAPKKFSRFFGGNTTKKRQRLVMITSAARLILAAAGGEEKKAKMDLSLLGEGTGWRSYKDSKGITAWCIDTN
ncbi:putative serine threonine protein kinase [Diplodia seriata]|uniref:non-specific serine/threonine protein kinase n=1 Tax=Diplodia seriata TaxID=420778 RepID=A0A0G2E047_9PEZI|nr:putative serine threonine protein kinase [Diplodia seriata]